MDRPVADGQGGEVAAATTPADLIVWYHSPMSPPTGVPSAALISDLALAVYGLDLAEPPRLLSAGLHSIAWRLTTATGAWIAKVYLPRGEPRERVEDEVRLFAYLNERGLRAPLVRSAGDGRDLVEVPLGDETGPLILMRAEPLRRVTAAAITAAEMRQVGATLAHLHLALRNYPNPVEIDYRLVRGSAYPHLVSSPNAAAFTPAQLHALRAIDERLVAYVRAAYPDTVPLTASLLHGDVGLHHAGWLPSGDLYLFDFGDRGRGPVAHELGIVLQYLIMDQAGAFAHWETLRRQLLAGYRGVADLSAADEAAIIPFMVNRIVGQTVYVSKLARRTNQPVGAGVIWPIYELGDYVLSTG